PESLSQDILEEQLNWSNYAVKGELLWEGLDVTSQETIQRLTQLLISPDNALTEQDTLCQVAEQLRSLFRAETTALLSWRANQAQVFLCQHQTPEQLPTFTHQTLEDSHILKATAANRVWNVPDLQGTCHTELERQLLERGCQSLLLIPLRQETTTVDPSQMGSLLGMLILGSDRANNFDQLDATHAESLIPALRIALTQATETRFSRVHPAVEWRFLQEAERRGMGLPPEKIIFNDVYPMYGISDIRGSSRERNRAIQQDLLSQFDLALRIVEAALDAKPIAFLEQLQIDLLAYLERLSHEVHVEDEVTAIHYLQQHIEVYFDYFRQCGDAAIAAVDAYNVACDPQQHCIYDSRKQYDAAIQQITAQLRTTWEQWQDQMQEILPHYCDMEVSDGIDHMIYVGSAIDSNFSVFHLHSLRYEQLRAICDCARTCFDLRERTEMNLEVSHLVLVQHTTVNIFHDEQTERLFDVMGTKDTRYEIVKKRIDKGVDTKEGKRITQPGMLTIVYSSEQEWSEYHQYLRYLVREGWVDSKIESGTVQALQGVTGLKFARVAILPEDWEVAEEELQE
ncbi:MAG: GAF domain-containing protein, partial [Kamptonema sp. SIO4C4]|nr:GAF domain-containing protein [Kamptonema sp. SIO4C4]